MRPVQKVWARIQDFHDLSWATDIITHTQKVGAVNGNKVGAKRILNDLFHETLVKIDQDDFLIKYSIDDGPSPVSRDEVTDYCGVVKLSPIDNGNKTQVEWSSSWEANTKDAVEFCNNIYAALLNALDKSFKAE